mgnify:CR=1 FL=1
MDDQASGAGPGDNMPGSDFTTFVISLCTSALLHLGEIPDPDGGKPNVNLGMARHTIDVLTMLKEKTAGNLTPEEEQVLGQFLYDLRMKFIAKTG